MHTKTSFPFDMAHCQLLLNNSFSSAKRDLKHQPSRSKARMAKPSADYQALRDKLE